MSTRIFVAGATGAVGRVVCQILAAEGYEVFGMTRRRERAAQLESLQVHPAIADVYDAPQVASLLASIRPTVIIHQLTDLPFGLPAEQMEAARARNAKIRDLGTRNLILGCRGLAVRRFIAQSIAFAYQPGPQPYDEQAPLASPALRDFERQVLGGDFAGVVLRYGRFYGPATGVEALAPPCVVHVDAAAHAAALAVARGGAGIYNVVEDVLEVTSRRAIAELGWNPQFRMADQPRAVQPIDPVSRERGRT